MERKVLFLVILISTLAVVVAGILLFMGEGGDELPLKGPENPPEALEEPSDSEGLSTGDPKREALVPQAPAMAGDEPGPMPASYRKALGGLRGRVRHQSAARMYTDRKTVSCSASGRRKASFTVRRPVSASNE